MGKDDVSTKKRRKLNSTPSVEASKLSPADVYKVRIIIIFSIFCRPFSSNM